MARILCITAFVLTLATTTAMAEKPRYTVLLFTADDMHAESMRTYGSKSDMTPNLDRFAETGMVFDRAHVNAAICAPSRAVIATGLYSHNSGGMGFMPTRPGIPDIVTILRKAGYLAGILGKVPHSTPVPGMSWDYQFDQRELGDGPRRSPHRPLLVVERGRDSPADDLEYRIGGRFPGGGLDKSSLG